jgi:hypothetical protein
LSRELLAQWEALWTFRRVEGCRFVERMLSVGARCAQQGRPLFAFVTAAVRAAWADQPAPILVPSP